jgi:hypothetical protein
VLEEIDIVGGAGGGAKIVNRGEDAESAAEAARAVARVSLVQREVVALVAGEDLTRFQSTPGCQISIFVPCRLPGLAKRVSLLLTGALRRPGDSSRRIPITCTIVSPGSAGRAPGR